MVAGRSDIPLERLQEFCARHGVTELSLFGSVLREDFGEASDVDVLIALEPGQMMSIEKYLDMRDELSQMFDGRPVDLVQKRLLKNPFRRDQILRTRRVVYAA